MTANEVLVFTGDPAAHKDLDVYAPAIYYLDSDMLIFGNGTGLVIYDLADSRVEGLVDMQAICSGSGLMCLFRMTGSSYTTLSQAAEI